MTWQTSYTDITIFGLLSVNKGLNESKFTIVDSKASPTVQGGGWSPGRELPGWVKVFPEPKWGTGQASNTVSTHHPPSLLTLPGEYPPV